MAANPSHCVQEWPSPLDMHVELLHMFCTYQVIIIKGYCEIKYLLLNCSLLFMTISKAAMHLHSLGIIPDIRPVNNNHLRCAIT